MITNVTDMTSNVERNHGVAGGPNMVFTGGWSWLMVTRYLPTSQPGHSFKRTIMLDTFVFELFCMLQ